MNKQVFVDMIVYGIVLWLIGYILGIILFPIVPNAILGWTIMPIGIVISLWVLTKKIRVASFYYYFLLAIMWTGIAVMGDYVLLVLVFHPLGYYKPDVYIYYLLTFLLPLFIGWIKSLHA
ncbi:MAG: hypothetical protein KGJ07_05375 [Patescibacteria group bacterium]|nr:hypothetical protein [Patescibacteria group bacterium]MDE2590592.1 hypothetical protein [Patescibacteria group bacterium]